jgi:Tol biopolymer transport system component
VKIRDNSTGWSVSPDGKRIAFTAERGFYGDRQLWFMDSDGSEPKKVFQAMEDSGIWRAQWSRTGQRLAYMRLRDTGESWQVSLESQDLNGGTPTILFSNAAPALRDFYWLPNGNVLYSAADVTSSGGSYDCNLWELPVDDRTGTVTGQARKLTDWAGFSIDALSGTYDGTYVSFRKWTSQHGFYVADLRFGNTKIENPKKMTFVAADSFPTGWTTDSKAVIFLSNRNGRWGIYKQDVNSESADTLLTTTSQPFPRVSPDGKWLIYMEVPPSGGPQSSQALRARVMDTHRCARTPSRLCAYPESSPDHKRLIIKGFDYENGSTRQLASFDTQPDAQYNWDLSPDGTRIAIARQGGHQISILSLRGSQRREITWSGSIGEGFDWASDGTGLFVAQASAFRTSLYFVSLTGTSHMLWHQNTATFFSTWGLSSPDGRRLAIHAPQLDSNIWMVSNISGIH